MDFENSTQENSYLSTGVAIAALGISAYALYVSRNRTILPFVAAMTVTNLADKFLQQPPSPQPPQTHQRRVTTQRRDQRCVAA